MKTKNKNTHSLNDRECVIHKTNLDIGQRRKTEANTTKETTNKKKTINIKTYTDMHGLQMKSARGE
jgi:hypothetical protein